MSTAEKTSGGRIEVAPEALHTIARLSALAVAGVAKVAPVPADMGRLFRRSTGHDGVILDFSEGKLRFDVYLHMLPNVNVLQTSRRVQAAIVEAMDKMVGLPVEWVNVHVEDVVYTQETTAS